MSATTQTFLTSLLPPFFHRAVVFAGSALVHPPHPSSFVRFCLLFFSSLKGTLKVFVASLCYWLLKRYFQYLVPQKYNSLSSTLALFFLFVFFFIIICNFCATSWATVYKARIYYYLCNATTILYWFVSESQCFSKNKVWNTSKRINLFCAEMICLWQESFFVWHFSQLSG